MIKNNTQLRRAQARLEKVRAQIASLQRRFSGIELEILTTPLSDEVKELEAEVMEFQELLELSLEEVVQGPLREPMLLDNIGELLAKLRIAAGLTQEELATQMGWQQSNLSRFESENYHSQTIAKVVKYAGSLGIWLHVSPSLTESPPKIVINRGWVRPAIVEMASTSDEICEAEVTTDSPKIILQYSKTPDYSELFRSQEQTEMMASTEALITV